MPALGYCALQHGSAATGESASQYDETFASSTCSKRAWVAAEDSSSIKKCILSGSNMQWQVPSHGIQASESRHPHHNETHALCAACHTIHAWDAQVPVHCTSSQRNHDDLQVCAGNRRLVSKVLAPLLAGAHPHMRSLRTVTTLDQQALLTWTLSQVVYLVATGVVPPHGPDEVSGTNHSSAAALNLHLFAGVPLVIQCFSS